MGKRFFVYQKLKDLSLEKIKTNIVGLSLGIILFVCSCTQGTTIKNEVSTNQKFIRQFEDEFRRDSLSKRLLTGDTTSYKELQGDYLYSGHDKEWCYYAFVMANKYNFRDAYIDLYLILRNDDTIDGGKLD
ncbi:MAG: hypothetical protein EOP48_11765, partial [Sphingobacteriales bacterium]